MAGELTTCSGSDRWPGGWNAGCTVKNGNRSDGEELWGQMVRCSLVHSKEGEVYPIDNETLQRSFNWNYMTGTV